MGDRELLADLERRGWRALSDTPDAAEAFYRELLDDDVEMLVPGGLRITDRAEALRSMSGAPWDGFVLEDVRVDLPRTGVGLVTYGVVARRGVVRYSAWICSTYVRRAEGWRLVLHQQTPR
ncbi:nuclear transport factor 2 family protein [Isoptericola sp. b441]|uniref:Nuclear transport factor 2 family protein n=1 Tax=Actinotalea lenta TaxID=3064654 RepID=A0ABT9DB55_9CELL|nr:MULTISPECIES: nuclear transport factor 2 family protein [unclassified Isoptericola]MDO8106541.1 nuclear transport factor 2 family protein [Isoptericola sp. b441]MDO8121751.1 nuclear transport factor 2 family protein [Isoptericola sp. b490]